MTKPLATFVVTSAGLVALTLVSLLVMEKGVTPKWLERGVASAWLLTLVLWLVSGAGCLLALITRRASAQQEDGGDE